MVEVNQRRAVMAKGALLVERAVVSAPVGGDGSTSGLTVAGGGGASAVLGSPGRAEGEVGRLGGV